MAVRPIDAMELKQRMYALCNQDYSDEPCEPSDCVFVRAINEAPTLTQPNEWVNVEERLPEEGESVLCIVNGKPRKNITLCEAYQLGVWCKEDGWLIDEYPEWRDVEVLWWMPLPDAPEGEK